MDLGQTILSFHWDALPAQKYQIKQTLCTFLFIGPRSDHVCKRMSEYAEYADWSKQSMPGSVVPLAIFDDEVKNLFINMSHPRARHNHHLSTTLQAKT